MQSVIVFDETAIADFAITKDLLNEQKGMLHLGTTSGSEFLDFRPVGIQLSPNA